jgi:hypothetical protein
MDDVRMLALVIFQDVPGIVGRMVFANNDFKLEIAILH